MFRIENPETGEGNNKAQEVYRLEYQRVGGKAILLGEIRRDLLQIAVVPRWNYIHLGGKRIYSHRPLGPVVHHNDAQFLMMWDQPYKNASVRGRQIETPAILQDGRLVRDSVVVNSDPDHFCYVDFAKPMHRMHQMKLECPDIGPLKADLTGEPGVLRLVRQTRAKSDYLDVCLGELPNGDWAALYRFDVADFLGKDPRAVLAVGTMPEPNCVEVVGEVDPKTVVVTLRKTCRYTRAQMEKGRFRLMRGIPSSSWNLDDEHHCFLFDVCNEMQEIMNNAVLGCDKKNITPGGTPEVIQDPSVWAPDVLVEFSSDTLEHLTMLRNFQVSDTLVLDILKDLKTGEFVLPASFPVDVPSGFYTEAQLREKTGEHFMWLVDKFLQSRVVRVPTVSGPLLKMSYVTSVLDQARRERGGVSWYWDFRRAFGLDEAAEVFMLPPMRYRGEREVQIGDVMFRVGIPDTRRITHKRQQQKTQRDMVAA
jgi:hypothetical protein